MQDERNAWPSVRLRRRTLARTAGGFAIIETDPLQLPSCFAICARRRSREPAMGEPEQDALSTARFAAWREGLRAADGAEGGEWSHVWANQWIFVGN